MINLKKNHVLRLDVPYGETRGAVLVDTGEACCDGAARIVHVGPSLEVGAMGVPVLDRMPVVPVAKAPTGFLKRLAKAGLIVTSPVRDRPAEAPKPKRKPAKIDVSRDDTPADKETDRGPGRRFLAFLVSLVAILICVAAIGLSEALKAIRGLGRYIMSDIESRLREGLRRRAKRDNLHRIAQLCGVRQPVLHRFLHDGRSLSLANATKLLKFLGLKIRA